jgi:hypothetical protein
MSRDTKISEPPPMAKPLGLSLKERQYLDSLVADLRAGRVGGEINRADAHAVVTPTVPTPPQRRKWQTLFDALAIAIGLIASVAMIWMINRSLG